MKVFIVNPGMVNDYVYELASSMHKNNHSVYLFGSDDYGERQKIFCNFNYYNHFLNVEKIKLRRLKKVLKGLLYIYLQFYLLKSIIKEKPDIIHLQWCRIPIIDYIFISLFSKYSKIIFTLHNTTVNHGEKSISAGLFSFGYKKFLRKTTKIIVHTEYSKNKFKLDYPEFANKIMVIPHGMLTFPKKIKNKFNFKFNQNKVLLFFGHIERYKGLDILVEAMSHLKHNNLILLVAGKANIELDSLKNRVNELSITSKIHWHTKFIDDADVEEIYGYSDLVILPHRHIDQSGILMSAINFCKPVVASNTGGFSEIIENGKHGFLFKPEDPIDLSKKIIEIIEANKFKEVNKNMIALKDSWPTWDKISLETIEIYKNSLDLRL